MTSVRAAAKALLAEVNESKLHDHWAFPNVEVIDALQEALAAPPGPESLTAEECMALRVALIFGDPTHRRPYDPDPRLESAKAKLRAIEND